MLIVVVGRQLLMILLKVVHCCCPFAAFHRCLLLQIQLVAHGFGLAIVFVGYFVAVSSPLVVLNVVPVAQLVAAIVALLNRPLFLVAGVVLVVEQNIVVVVLVVDFLHPLVVVVEGKLPISLRRWLHLYWLRMAKVGSDQWMQPLGMNGSRPTAVAAIFVVVHDFVGLIVPKGDGFHPVVEGVVVVAVALVGLEHVAVVGQPMRLTMFAVDCC